MLGLTVPDLISRIITLLVAFTIHELAHAWTAGQLGDDTPRRMGRLTLNPLAHLDPIGSLLLIVAGFGWAKPVQVNPYNLRNGPHLGMAIVAAAGPISNFVMAALAAIPLRLRVVPDVGGGTILPTAQGFLADFIFLNLVLMLFNLIPITPLDGSKILRGFAPREWDSFLLPLEQWGPFLLMALVFLGGSVMSLLIGRPAITIFNALVGR
jgi:Zn-dependent protease